MFYKSSFLKLCLILITSNVNSQSFGSLNGGVNQPVYCLYADSVNNLLYVGGGFSQSGATQTYCISKWDGMNWDSTANQFLSPGVSQVRSIEKFNGDIYICGPLAFVDSLGIQHNGAAKWDSLNKQWIDFGVNCSFLDKIYSYNTELYFSGSFDSIGGIYSPKIASYDGMFWTGFPTLGAQGGFILNEINYNGELYVGGNFDSQSNPSMKDIARWDGTQWQSVSNGLSGFSTNIRAFTIYQGNLIVAGYFNTSFGDPGNNIVAWNGFNWSQLGDGLDNEVRCLAVYNGELWAGGIFLNAGTIPVTYLAKWDGIQWHSLNINLNNIVMSMAVLNNDLYIAGAFVTMNGDTVNRIIRYNNSTGIYNINEKNNNLGILPNPSSGIIQLNFNTKEKSEINVYDLIGNKMHFEVLKSNSNYKIDLSNLSSGVYIIQLKTQSQLLTQKIILNH